MTRQQAAKILDSINQSTRDSEIEEIIKMNPIQFRDWVTIKLSSIGKYLMDDDNGIA